MTTQPWKDHHTHLVTRAIISTILSSRQSIRTYPGLEEVSNNGGDRINKKIIQLLKKFADSVEGAEGRVVEEELAKLGSTGGRAGKGDGGSVTPSPKKGGGKKVTPKKRKVKQEEEEEEEEEEEIE